MVIGVFRFRVKVFLTLAFRQQMIVGTVCTAGCRNEPAAVPECPEIHDPEGQCEGTSCFTVVRTKRFDDSAGFFLDRLQQVQTSFIDRITAAGSPWRERTVLVCFGVH